MIPGLRKVDQLNIKYIKKWGPIIDVCTGAPPDEITAQSMTSRYHQSKNIAVNSSITCNLESTVKL